MTDIPKSTAAMEGKGSYNRNSRLQEANLTSLLPLLEEAAEIVPLDPQAGMLIADYGASEGRNSMRPMGMAIDILRGRAGAAMPISITHTDLPSNDFASLFTTLESDPVSYLAGRDNVFPSAIGRTYFAPLLPPGSVTLGWSSNAVHWMSQTVNVPDHGWAKFSASADARDAVEVQQAIDWQNFLDARSVEMRPGGRTVCQFMGRGDDVHGFEWMAGLFWDSVAELEPLGMVSADELLRMTNPSSGRSPAQVEAPFIDGEYSGLRLYHLSRFDAPDPFWDEYSETGDVEKLARSWAATMRAANGPNFVAALDPGRDRDAFLDAVTQRLVEKIMADPQRSQSWILLVGLEKLA